ncbi:MAG: YlzJ-like family protein [Bacillota bacterium]
MIIWTPMQLELVLAGGEKETRPEREVVVNEVPAVIRETGFGEGEIVRLLSTDAFDYLRPELAPGTRVVLHGDET